MVRPNISYRYTVVQRTSVRIHTRPLHASMRLGCIIATYVSAVAKANIILCLSNAWLSGRQSRVHASGHGAKTPLINHADVWHLQ